MTNSNAENNVKVITGTELSNVDYNLVLANGLIEANHNLVLNENKLMNAVISQIGMYDSEIKVFEFTTKQLQEICNLNPLHIKRTLHSIRKNLLNKTFSLKDEIERDGKSEEITTEYHWIRYIKYNDNRWIIRLSDDLAPLLLNLKKEFTTKRLMQIQTYENVYAQRLDMIFTMYFNRKTSKMPVDSKLSYKTKVSYSLDELRKMFRLEEKYLDFNNFNRCIIQPALDELNDKGYFIVDAELKKGLKNRCEGITFFFSLGEESKKEMRETDIDKIQKLLCFFSYSKKEAENILQELDMDDLQGIFSRLAKQRSSMNDEEQVKFVRDNIKFLQDQASRDSLLESFLS